MAITKKLIHFQKWETFMSDQGVNGNWETPSSGSETTRDATYGQINGSSIVFIKDVQKIWTHGKLYSCGSNIQAVDTEDALDDVGDYATKAYVDLLSDRVELLETMLNEILIKE